MQFILLFSLCLVAVSLTDACTNPDIGAVSYTTQDATIITKIAFVAEFTLKCQNGPSDIPLYAEVGGNVFPVASIGKDKYQVSWTEEIGKSRSGDYPVNLFDEEGYGALRKAIRNDEYISNVKPLGTVILNHPGTYQGPWVNSELMAVFLAALVWYLAYSAKSKLLL